MHGVVFNQMEGEWQMGCLPPGFRFFPTDEELVTFYLGNKAMDASFTSAAIRDVDLYKSEPWDLPSTGKAAMTAGSGGDECYYFFCKRSIRYPSGARARRSTAGGYWKSTGKDKDVHCSRESNRLVGTKKTLVFHRGRAPRGEKTSWVMHEYMLLAGQRSRNACSRADQGEWVICRVFVKKPPSDHRTLERDLGQGEALHGQTSPGHLLPMDSDGCNGEEAAERAASQVLSDDPWDTNNRAMTSHENDALVHHVDPSLIVDRPSCASPFWPLYDDDQLGPYCSTSTLHILQQRSSLISATDDLPELLEYGGYDIPKRGASPGSELTSSSEAEISYISVVPLHLDESYWNFGC
ncbi:NAC domain-containing protein 46 [Brachypodium distachyon]|nr:NAC domain-containing protein 46 [Brachypodium distachyon]PNT68156.1 hypothetical protein BRADI_3g36670v3 [Brachypodium distachyon]|eukprot:XP_024316300.1 NAC domain-containing protein 46 [Brachypodium distachyon]